MLIEIDEVTAGMVLTEDVILPNGTTLLNCSATLTERYIQIIKRYGIEHIQVQEEAPPEEDGSEAFEEMSEVPEQESLDEEPEKPEVDEDTTNEAEEDDSVYTQPKITVAIENEGMSAFLRIEPAGGKRERFTVDDLRTVLQENDIFFGINESLLEESVKKWQTSPEVYEFENIAQGIAATASKESELDIEVKHINTPRDFETVKQATYCWELQDAAIPVQRVDTGVVIAKKDISIPGIPGKNVHGDEINSDQVIKTEIKYDENVLEEPDNDLYKSTVTGLVYYVNNTLGVLPINFDGSAELSVSQDTMQAGIIIHPALENGLPPSEKEIRTLLIEYDIVFGVNNEALTNLVQQVNKGLYPDGPVTIAEGNPPTNGGNGTIEYLFSTETSLKPKVNASGVADYKNISIIQSVNEGDELARLLPPTEGEPGTDIHGTELPCKAGNPAILPVGANTKPSPADENVLVAQTDGNVRLKGQLVEIYEGFTIKGDVDYSTGNIDYDKSVSIGGDVKAGFTINCGGDLEVGGTIEDAVLHVGGSVLCKYGFIGQGKGIIHSKGDVNVGFMKNQTIKCRSNVNIAREALNCTIFARRTITVSGKSLSIAGGTYVARDSITCNVAGNSSGIHTTLEVGLDYTLMEEMEKTETQVNEILKNRKKLLVTFKHYEQMLNVRKKLPPKEEFLYAKLKNTIVKHSSQLKTLEERKTKIETKMRDTAAAFIKIEHAAMPGTLFKFGERHFLVHDEIIGPKTIRSINYEIRVM